MLEKLQASIFVGHTCGEGPSVFLLQQHHEDSRRTLSPEKNPPELEVSSVCLEQLVLTR